MPIYPIGSKIYVAGEKRPYKVQAADSRYAIATKSHFGTVLYTILDFKNKIRGKDNMVFSAGYESQQDCNEALIALNDNMEVSRRNCVPLDVRGADWEVIRVRHPDGSDMKTPIQILAEGI